MSTFSLKSKHGHNCNENGNYSSEYGQNSSENCNCSSKYVQYSIGKVNCSNEYVRSSSQNVNFSNECGHKSSENVNYSNECGHKSSENVNCSIEYDSSSNYGHYSSEGQRLDSIANNEPVYFCPSCVGIQHKRRKLVLDSGTIHNANVNTLFHLDLEIIPGGKVWDMQRCLKKFYYIDPTPIDVVVICGLNQLKEHSVERIVASYRSLVQCVMAHSRENGHTRPNSICISTLLYPPKFCSFKDLRDESFPSYLTKETNLLSKIDEINRAIEELNEAALGRGELKNVFAMHLYGIRSRGGGIGPHGKREHRWNYWHEEEDSMKLHLKHRWNYWHEEEDSMKHRWNHWHEEEDSMKLHLKHEWRESVLHRIHLYFIYNTKW